MTDALVNENYRLRRLLWQMHGHKGIYGDDGEMQCSECFRKYGFWDWKRTAIDEIEQRIAEANIKEFAKIRSQEND